MGILDGEQQSMNSTGNTTSSGGFDLGSLAGGVINAATGGLMNHLTGMVFGGAEDGRQRNQQQQLTNIKEQADENEAAFGQMLGMKTWEETNYPAQVAMMEKAGLNPGLLESKGGTGGTVGSSSMPGAQGGQAANAAETQRANLEMGMSMTQMELMQAQAEEAKAGANLSNTQATKLAGVDTENTAADTGLKGAQTATQKANAAYTEAQTEFQKNTNIIQGQTIQDQISNIVSTAETAASKAVTAANDAKVSTNTVDDQIKKIKADAITAVLTQALVRSNTAVNNEQVKNLANEIVNRDAQTQINQAQLDINRGQLQTNRAQQNTNQQDIELQHGDRQENIKNTLKNWEAWQLIGQQELIIQATGSILGAAGKVAPAAIAKPTMGNSRAAF